MDQSQYIVTYIDWTKIDVWCCDQFFSSDEIDKHVEKVHKISHSKTVHDNSIESETLKAEKKSYPCEICPKTFFNKNILEIHVKVHKKISEGKINPPKEDGIANGATEKARDTGKYYCYICDKTFKYSGDLKKHKRVHTKEKPYSCSFCGRSFSQACNRNKHVQLKHSSLWKSNPQCAIVKPLLTSDSTEKLGEMVERLPANLGDSQYHEHKEESTRPKRHRGKEVSYYEHKEEGMTRPKRHRGKEVNADKSSLDVKCDEGKNVLEAINSEKDHNSPEIERTTNQESVKAKCEKLFLCSYQNCLKSFATKKYLKQHMFSHTGEKPFNCDECTKVFARKSILKGHRLTHNASLKPFQCDVETLVKVREETMEEVPLEKVSNENSKLPNINTQLPVVTEVTTEIIPTELKSQQVSQLQTASAGDVESDVQVQEWRLLYHNLAM